MTLPSSGPLSIGQILAEIGDSYPVTIPNANWRTLAGKPTGPLVIPNDFWGKSWKSVTQTDDRTTAATSHSNVSFGTERAGSWVVVLATHGNTGSSPGITPTATIGGVSATRIAARSTGTGSGTACGSAMFVAQPVGASGTVAVSWHGLATSIIVLRVVGYNCGTAYATDSAFDGNMPMTVNIPAGGLGIGFVSRGFASELSWTGLTEQGADSTDSLGKRRSLAWDIGMSAETGRSISVSPWTGTNDNGTNAALVASFSPA